MRGGDLPQPREVHARQAGLVGDLVDPRGTGVLDLVHRMAKPRNPRSGVDRPRDPALHVVTDLVEEADRVLHDTQKHGSRTQKAGRHRPLKRLRRTGMGESRGQDGRGEPVIGQRDEDGVEETRLLGGGQTPLHHQEGELGKGDLAHEVPGQVPAHDGDAVGVGCPDGGFDAHVGSLCFATRPVAVWGSSSSASYWLGTLKAVSRSDAHSRSSSKLASAPSRSTTNALMSSSESSEGTPTTAASTTSGCETSAASISAGDTFSPRRRITSFLRPRKVKVPSGFSRTRSPVRSQPSAPSTRSVSSGIPQ